VKYTKNSVFTRSELLELNPTVIRRWLTMKAYNKEVYNPDVDAPTEVRSSTIANAKKFVSFFMPNKTEWVNGVGNPTRHASVNKVISDVKKAEVRRRGKADCSKRPLTEKEFRKTLEIKKKNLTGKVRYFTLPCAFGNLLSLEETMIYAILKLKTQEGTQSTTLL